ncbi:amylo-alpha-1,6-glucosidase [Paenalkalicoccus suaedae]|uniref:Amylo-alpha-1,6-glucosidase n=1 Tax=Paenalkalicoccus suaedae TaxID=2592382 RepID=A0A859FCJ6_9BACI|nr:amylo-alpha-1,6-glucosidase [Paenalkalicoccus suaedae]QKS70660.1 amylo-alpha-1,6-glucosidase [Paenalkalicoccus suaedae]
MSYRVIKEDDLFLLTDENGDIPKDHTYGPGLYTKDTRFLSEMTLTINKEKPIMLSSAADENYIAEIIMTNPHQETEEELLLWRESIEIKRKRFIHDGVLYEQIQLTSFAPKPIVFNFEMTFEADFKDMFIIRGFQHGEIGTKNKTDVSTSSMTFHYSGADSIERATRIEWDKVPSYVKEGEIGFTCSLSHSETETVTFAICPEIGDEKSTPIQADKALQALKDSYAEWEATTTKIHSNNDVFNRLIKRGVDDMRVLLTDMGYGKFPVAGLPWFGVPFGRDSLIAAMQLIPFRPEVAKGTLRTMASEQGKQKDPWRDEEPGKIMHEMRFGELANTGQVPFTPYYGTIDATPLFLLLLTDYVKWTGDLELFNELEENVSRALEWIDSYGDRDEDGFVEYHQEAAKGIANQGWKDSGDSIVHRNGDLAVAPIALAEVQGYVYEAKTSLASIYIHLGKKELSNKLQDEATKLAAAFEESFWMKEHDYYALALDGHNDQVGTITSNPGHVLRALMVKEDRAKKIVNMLLSDRMFSGFGIRTMAKGEAGYNPISYHNGTIWPHDNSLIILGMSKAFFFKEAAVAIKGLMDVAPSFEYDRLPELFCGYEKKAVKYPVACSPQAWAAGTPLMCTQAMLGLFPDALNKSIQLAPYLPDGIDELTVTDMAISDGVLNIKVMREDNSFKTDILLNTTGCTISTLEQVSP